MSTLPQSFSFTYSFAFSLSGRFQERERGRKTKNDFQRHGITLGRAPFLTLRLLLD
jgi:hypothetical protein